MKLNDKMGNGKSQKESLKALEGNTQNSRMNMEKQKGWTN